MCYCLYAKRSLAGSFDAVSGSQFGDDEVRKENSEGGLKRVNSAPNLSKPGTTTSWKAASDPTFGKDNPAVDLSKEENVAATAAGDDRHIVTNG